MNSMNDSALNYTFLFEFETAWDEVDAQVWMNKNWHRSFYYVALYLTFLTLGQRYMALRKPFRLTGALFLWNVGLAVFSIIGAARSVAYLVHLLQTEGFHYAACERGPLGDCKVFGFWVLGFAWSKVWELGDSAFIVLRKKPLIFLHWYHHITVLLLVWYTTGQARIATPARWYCAMNFIVHSFMYLYYALKVLRVRVPRSVSMLITLLQLSQMVVGLSVTLYAYRTVAAGGHCLMPEEYPKVALFIYFSYFLLFLRFFYCAYIGNRIFVGINFGRRVALKKMD